MPLVSMVWLIIYSDFCEECLKLIKNLWGSGIRTHTSQHQKLLPYPLAIPQENLYIVTRTT
jgi:hypothetical protein